MDNRLENHLEKHLERKYEDIKRIKSVRWLIFYVILAQFVCQALLRAVMSFIGKDVIQSERMLRYIQLGITTAVPFLVAFAVYGAASRKNNEKNFREEMRLNFANPKYFMPIAVMGISGQFVMALLNLPISRLTSEIFGSAGASSGAFVPMSGGEMAAAIISVGILPAFFEELWMRGFVLGVYEKRSTLAAIVFTTVIFGLLHGSAAKLPGVLFMGFTAAMCAIKTKSVFAAMLFHGVCNITGVIYSYIAMNYKSADSFVWVFASIMVVVFFASFMIFLVITPKIARHKCRKEGAMILKNIFSIPIILCFAIIFLRYWFFGRA